MMEEVVVTGAMGAAGELVATGRAMAVGVVVVGVMAVAAEGAREPMGKLLVPLARAGTSNIKV
jgi:hypothetical protein